MKLSSLSLLLWSATSVHAFTPNAFPTAQPFLPLPPQQSYPPPPQGNVNPLQQQPQPSATSTLERLPNAEADRAFRYAISLESAGLPRTAHAAYHEAATLFQCFLDSTEFSHVTNLGNDETEDHENLHKYLVYSCLRLAFLSQDALSDPKAALRLYKEAAILDTSQPSAEAYDGIGTATEASLGDLQEAVAAYETALTILSKDQETLRKNSSEEYYYNFDNSGIVKFHLGVALERLNRMEEAEEIFENLRRSEAQYSSLVDSWGYIRWHTRRIEEKELNLYMGTRDMLKIGTDAAMQMVQEQDGLVCEFGVAKGRSMRLIQELLPLDTPIHGFDTFTGLPQSWNSLPAGAFSTNGDIPNIEGESKQPLAFANIDALLYGSTLDILESVHSRVVPGTVFVFADYCCHPTWRQDEFRAWRECCKRFGWTYEYLGFSLATKQAVVRVTGA